MANVELARVSTFQLPKQLKMADDRSQQHDPGDSVAGVARSRRWAVWAVAGLIAVAGLAAFWFSPWRTPPVGNGGSDVATDIAGHNIEADEPAARVNPGYVGVEACVACHAERVAEFKATRHFLACCTPQAATMPAAFTKGKGTFATRDPAVHFEMGRVGDDYVITGVQKTATGEKRTSSPIAFVYGAGAKTDEVYFTWHGERLYELPISWLHPGNEWGASGFDPHGSGDFSRELTPKCVECHNTWFNHTPGTLNKYQPTGFVLGVTCEKCHGPGREHVEFHQAHPEAATAKAVVHPGHLSHARQMDLCAQCHSNAIKYRGPAFSYRPGEPLDDYFRTVASKHPEDDHVANQTKYLVTSKCYQKSGTMTCTTCHNPHRPKEGTSSGKTACFKCHKQADCTEQPRIPVAVQGDCVGCHMPPANKIQVNFRTEHDEYLPPVKRWEHRIGIYPVAQQQVLLAWYRTQSDDHSREEAARLTQDLTKFWLAEMEKCRREFRFLAAIEACRQALQLDPSPGTRDQLKELLAIQSQLDADWQDALHEFQDGRIQEAIEKLENIVRVKPDLAKAQGKLGTAYAQAGQQELAIRHLQLGIEGDPDDPYNFAMIGWLAFLKGQYAEALEHFRQAEEVEPYNAKINYQIGITLVKLERWSDAEKRLRRLLIIDPNHGPGCQALSHALRRQGQAAEAVHFAERAARLTEFKNVDVLVTLADSYADAGRFSEAVATASRAIDAAAKGDPQVLSKLLVHREEIRARGKRIAK